MVVAWELLLILSKDIFCPVGLTLVHYNYYGAFEPYRETPIYMQVHS